MSLFVFSALAGFLLYQIVARIQPIANAANLRFGDRVVVELPERSYIIWKAVSIAVTVILFIFVVTLIVAQSVHPAEGYANRFVDALTSPRMASALFGGLVGFLVGNLLNRILWSPPDYQFTASDRVEILVIFLLFILGIGGEEIIRSSARRINKISVGTTTEISFSENLPRNSRAAAEQPGGAFRNTAGENGGPTGLGKLGDLRDNIGAPIDQTKFPNYRSDGDFLRVLAAYEPAAKLTPDDSAPLAANVLSPIGTCLSGIFRVYGDVAFVRYQLRYLTIALRDLANAESLDVEIPSGIVPDPEPAPHGGSKADKPKKVKEHARLNLKDRIREINEYVSAKGDDYNNQIGKKDSGSGGRYSCNELSKAVPTETDITSFWTSRKDSPYPAIAYASVEAALQHYESAATTLYNWIRAHKDAKETDDPKNLRPRWYLLRAQFAQAAFVDEWIRSRGTAASSWLRQYHIDNLKSIADSMQSFNAIWMISQKNREFKWSNGLLGVSYSGDTGFCNFPNMPKKRSNAGQDNSDLTPNEDDQVTLKKLYDSYLSARNDFVDHALKDPITKRRSATIIQNEIKDLMTIDLRCIVDSRTRVRAGYIERYVRSEINLLENTSPLKSSDEVRQRIRDSQQLLSLAFQLIDHDVTRTRDDKIRAELLQKRIESDSILELYETLLATQSQLQDFSEREVTP